MPGKAAAIRAAIAASRERRSHGIGYNPPVVPQRGIEIDYPQHVPGMGIDRSIEGVPLDALYVAGRRGANAEDQAIGPEQLISAASSLAGVDRARLKGDYGQFKKVAGPNGGEYVIRIDKDKVAESSPQEYRVLAHEFGHLTDEAAAQIDQRGVESELRKVYHELNATPDERRKRGLIGPQHRRYSKKDQPAEMMAEAVAGYLMNPNWMKTTAPNLAKRIRQWANTNPRTRRVIQFNAPAAGAVAVVGGGMSPGVSDAKGRRIRRELNALRKVNAESYGETKRRLGDVEIVGPRNDKAGAMGAASDAIRGVNVGGYAPFASLADLIDYAATSRDPKAIELARLSGIAALDLIP